MSHGRTGGSLSAPEIGNFYVGDEDRFVVSLAVGYNGDDGVNSPEEAVAAALDLTRDGDRHGTHWFVYDRQTGQLHTVYQGVAEPLADFKAAGRRRRSSR